MPQVNRNPVIFSPDDPDQKIWRYMNFTKFVSMLETRALYFCRSDKLGDHYEGSLPYRNATAQDIIPPEIKKNMGPEAIAAEERHLAESTEDIHKLHKWSRQWMLINCWHMNDRESYAMWEIYAKSKEAIAIQSTYKRLTDCLDDTSGVHIGTVTYIDYLKDSIPPYNYLAPYFYKRKSFEYEQELRAVRITFPHATKTNITQLIADNPISDKIGEQISVNLSLLIEKIVIAPQAPDWFLDLLKQVVTRYDTKLPEPIRSPLDDAAMF